MSPAHASSTVARSSAIIAVPVASLILRSPCTWKASMPRTNLPEQMRRKAMRSRWFLSMLAWILKTKPEKSGSVASTGSPVRESVCGPGAGERRRKSRRNGSTPKLVSAEPKKTGVSLPVRTASRSDVIHEGAVVLLADELVERGVAE